MSPSHLNKYYRSSYRKDSQRLSSDFEELDSAYSAGNYTTAIDFLNSLLTNTNDQVGNAKRCEAREHILLARVMCFRQLREHEQVVIDTTEVEKTTAMNGTSVPLEVNSSSLIDHIFCRILALWLRSLAFESLESWERAKNDLDALKTLILEKNKNSMIPFKTEGVLSVFLPHMAPLIAQYKINSIIIDLRCVDDRQRRMKDLVAKDVSLRSSASQFRLIDEDIESCDDLAKKFHYRLLLRRPLNPNIHVNMWYTLDLMFVSEMGLFKRDDLIGIRGYALGCKLLEINADKKIFEKYEVQVRPLSVESREWSDCTDADWAGVQNGGKGGLEFRIVCTNKEESITTNGCNISKCNGGSDKCNVLNVLKSHPSAKLYLYVYPVREIVDENYNNKSENLNNNDVNGSAKNANIVDCINKESNSHLVPLSIGPIRIVSCGTFPNSCVHHITSNGSNGSTFSNNDVTRESTQGISTTVPSRKKSPWSIDDCLVDNYRSFILSNGKYLIVKELWDAGIPGKIWDSAFIIVQMIKDMILKDQNSFIGKRVLDLSTGTGFVGLYLAAFLSILKSDKSEENVNNKIILTDLNHALELVRGNLELNKYFLDSSNNKVTIDVEELQWGDLSKAKKFGILDYVFASDVVYEPDLFDSLAQTLIALCTPGQTKIYLGYKRRGLNKGEETYFFDKLRNVFQISAVQGLEIFAEEGKVNVYELSRK